MVDDESGGEDDDWYSSYFQPYRYVIVRVPVLPAIGNHDTTDTEGSDDREQMEDNFHIAQRFGGTSGRGSVRRFFQSPHHQSWLAECPRRPRRSVEHPVLAPPAVLRRATTPQ